MATHQQARQWAIDGFSEAFGRSPSLREVQFVQAVALLESTYGAGWKNDGVGSNNMGAVQAGLPPCDANEFLYSDSHPQSDGSSKRYEVCFKRYASPQAGMADVARILYKQMKIRPTSIHDVSQQMYEAHYYEGFGATKAARIAGHEKRLAEGLTEITTALGEPMPPRSSAGSSSSSRGLAVAGVALLAVFGLSRLRRAA